MKEISATDAARNFSELLDDLEHRGADFVIVRRGRRVAHLEPIETGTGSAVKDLLISSAPDAAWRTDLASVRDLLDIEDRG